MKKKESMRTAVLNAAVELVESSGAGLLTLDAVAARAGVSKGGLLHYFKSKDALLEAMVARVAEGFESETRASTERLVANAGHTTEHEVEMMLTYIDRSFAGLGTRNHSAMPLFAAAAHQPALLQPIRDYFQRRVNETREHSSCPEVVLMVMLLADGLWMFDALGIPPITGKLRKEIHQLVRQWSQQAIEADSVERASKKAAKPRKTRASKKSV